MNLTAEILISIPDLKCERSDRGGWRIWARQGGSGFGCVVRNIPGRMVYTTDREGVRFGKGWMAIDSPDDVARRVAELLLELATWKLGKTLESSLEGRWGET